MKVTTFLVFGLLLLYGVTIRAQDEQKDEEQVEGMYGSVYIRGHRC